MGNVYLLYAKDITTRAINNAIVERVRQSRKPVYITGSNDLKQVRLDMNGGALTEQSLMTMAEFEAKIKAKTNKRNSYITRADARYLLSRAIEKTHAGTEHYDIFKSITSDLYTLFEFLQWSGIPPLEKAVLARIQQNFSFYEHGIFLLYNHYCSLVDALITAAQTGEDQPILVEYGISCSALARKTIEALNAQLKAEIDREISKGSAVFFDGFYLMTDLRIYAVESALRQDKDVYFIAKMDFESREAAFVYERHYKKLTAKYGKEIQAIRVDAAPFADNTALDYFRRVYPNVYAVPSPEEQARIFDGSIEMIVPFASRENEFAYVARRISDHLRSLHTTDTTVLKKALAEDVAVLIPVDWERHAYMVKSALKKVGLFVLRENIETTFANIDFDSVGPIWYTKSEFMNALITHRDGIALNTQEKLVLFERCFIGLSIKTSPRPIAAYPVGQYVRQIYSFVVDGMDTHKFKLVLYSNWFYHTRHTDAKWDQFISDFDLVEHYFTDKTDIAQWLTEFDRLREIKAHIADDPLYEYHPLAHVPDESLVFLRGVTELLRSVMDCINFTGTIEEHVACLLGDVINAYSLIEEDRSALQHEQVIICRLHEAAEALSGSALVSEVDTAYFVQNILYMLEDFEREQVEDESGQYAFNVVSWGNAKKYKTVFFVMAERGKHPRNYKEQFPYSKEVIEILTDPQFGIHCKPAALYGLDYHIALNNYGITNFWDFITEKLIVTQSKRDSEGENAPSIYCEDIATAFGCELTELYRYPAVLREAGDAHTKRPKVRLRKKDSYTLTELAMFKLCPKLYFHARQSAPVAYRDPFQLKLYFQNIVFVDVLRQFLAYSTEHGKLYSVYDDEALRVMLGFLPAAYEKHLPQFSFLKSHERSDAMLYLHHMIVDFVCYEITGRNSSGYFAVRQAITIPHSCNGYELQLDYDMVIQHGEKYSQRAQKSYPDNRTYQSRMLIDFLRLHTKQKNGKFLEHYDDMLYALSWNDPRQDRIKLVSRMITKINAQFESNNFRAHGVARANGLVKELESMEFRTAQLPTGDYCRYCKFCDICKGYDMN